MTEVKKEVLVKLNVTEKESPLPGTAAWVLNEIREGELVVGVNKKNEPSVWLRHGKNKEKSQLLAVYEKDDYDGSLGIGFYPSLMSKFYGTDREALGVNLTFAGQKVLKRLAKKAKTLLKLSLRRGDQQADGKFNLKITLKQAT